jgi:hypothetical protein
MYEIPTIRQVGANDSYANAISGQFPVISDDSASNWLDLMGISSWMLCRYQLKKMRLFEPG